MISCIKNNYGRVKAPFLERVMIMSTLKRFIKDERGLETVEWVVMGAVIVLGVALLAGYLLQDIQTGLDNIGNEITSPSLPAATG